MKNSKNYLIVDLGASSGRVTAAAFNGSRFDLEEVYRFENRQVSATGTIYWDVLRLFSEIKTGIQIATKKYKNVDSVGIDTWGVDFVFIDNRGKLISNPLSYRDSGRHSIAEDFFRKFPRERLFKLTGGLLLSIMSIFNMYHLKLSGATELKHAKKFLMMPDLFNYFLSGETYNEFTNITTTLMYDIINKIWISEILDFLEISEDLFCRVLNPGEKIGRISEDISSELAIRPMDIISVASHDSASAVAGIPVKDPDKTWAFITMGTWCAVGVETPMPFIEKKVYETGYANIGGADGKNIMTKNITGFWIIEQCRGKWVRDNGADLGWEEIINESQKATPFEAFIDVDDPIFSAPETNMPQTIVDYCLNRSMKIDNNISQVSRCFYQSLAMKFKKNLEDITKITGKKMEILYLVGGGSKNQLLCQWIADLTGVEVVFGSVEATAIGNFLMQLLSYGEINNLDEGRRLIYDTVKSASFDPKDYQNWQDGYSKYLKILKII